MQINSIQTAESRAIAAMAAARDAAYHRPLPMPMYDRVPSNWRHMSEGERTAWRIRSRNASEDREYWRLMSRIRARGASHVHVITSILGDIEAHARRILSMRGLNWNLMIPQARRALFHQAYDASGAMMRFPEAINAERNWHDSFYILSVRLRQ